MSGRPQVVVVFAVLNQRATLRAVLDAIDTTDWPGLRAIAVDCGSTDGSRELLQGWTTRPGGVPLQLLDAPGAGRATALAMAMAAAGTADVVRLHADVVPDAPDWLGRLWQVCVDRPDTGIVGAKIVLPGGSVQSCGRNLINGLGIAPEWSDLRWMEADRDEPSRPTEVDGVAGELCWIRRAVLDATGGLDTNYDPVFGDDDDLCLLARWHGFAVHVEPAVRGVHHAPRWTLLTNDSLPDRTGLLQRQREDRSRLQHAHRDYFRCKWGFDPETPDLHEVRRRYGHTRICWRIGARLLETLPERPAVDVCFVTWNSRGVLPRMLDHLAATRWPEVRVFVTDNGSTDDTVAYLRQRAATFPFPLQVETVPQNLGCAQALNLAMRHGKAPLVARLDDDAFVPPDWLQGLVPNFHQRPYAGVVGPRTLHDNAGAALQSGPNRSWPGTFPGLGPGAADQVRGKVRVHAINGSCNLYRRSVFAVAGLLDVRFSPSQFDESDHHVAVLAAGYEAIYDGSVTVHHTRNAGRGATPAALGNFLGNRHKHDAKWGARQSYALDRAIDLSIDGRLLPPDGDTSALWAALPPVPEGPPARPARDPAEIAQWLAIARRNSLLRTTDSPLAGWWRTQVALCEQGLDIGDGLGPAMVTRLRDLLPYAPRALLAVATFQASEGDLPLAARTAARAARLAPDDAEVVQRARALATPALPIPRPTPPAPGPARVVLLPPLLPDRDVVDDVVQRTADALRAAGVPCRIDTNLVPEPGDAEVLHAFGLGDVVTLLGRLQVAKAMAPHCRIALTPLLADPARANWIGQHVGPACFAGAAELRAHHERLARVPWAERLAPGPVQPETAAYQARCLAFVDALVTFTAADHVPADGRLVAKRVREGLAAAVASGPPRGRSLAGLADGGVLAIGPRDLPGHHLSIALALGQTGLPVTMAGTTGFPFADGHVAQLADRNLQLCRAWSAAERASAWSRSAVLVWLPCAPVSFGLPLAAAAAGCELVLPRDVGAEAIFGPNASYVDPLDLPGLRCAVERAVARWQPRADATWRRQLAAEHAPARAGHDLLAAYGLTTATVATTGATAAPVFA